MKKYICVIGMAWMLFVLSGCEESVQASEKIRDLEFTVLPETHVPEEFGKILEERKEDPFKLTYRNEGWMYIAEGYGVQNGGGYSIRVNACYETKNVIYVDMNLMGPQAGEAKGSGQSFPYIVLKMENINKNVVFR